MLYMCVVRFDVYVIMYHVVGFFVVLLATKSRGPAHCCGGEPMLCCLPARLLVRLGCLACVLLLLDAAL
jgi:hypothetical protein